MTHIDAIVLGRNEKLAGVRRAPTDQPLTRDFALLIMRPALEIFLKKKGKPDVAKEELPAAVERLKQRMDMLDNRLDSIDSLVTAVADRVTKQPVTIIFTCPSCGRDVEIAVLGITKPRK
ncbi:MAG: hypothetical protein HYX79_00740 [Chloroflexi bacterium]|nr:hypothetical protein [Chloroflexota bacterium]